MKRRAEDAISRGETDSWVVKEYQERISPKRKGVSNQKCGYCSKTGHTRRKCEVLENDMNWFVQHHNEHVRVAYDYIVSSPIGIGSLFQQTVSVYDYGKGDYIKENRFFVLTDFELFKGINNSNIHIMATLSATSTAENEKIELRKYVRNRKEAGPYWRSVSLCSAASGIIPSDWISRQTMTIADAKKHELFVRQGKEDMDVRNYIFNNLDGLRENFAAHVEPYSANALRELSYFTADYNRGVIFKDFEYGQ
jgi:hypothetical protein